MGAHWIPEFVGVVGGQGEVVGPLVSQVPGSASLIQGYYVPGVASGSQVDGRIISKLVVHTHTLQNTTRQNIY